MDAPLAITSAIGTDDPASDWRLDPEAHGRDLPPQAGALRRVLERPDLREIMSRFKAADQRAVAGQKVYKGLGRFSLYAGVAATLIGACFIVVPLASWDNQAVRGAAVGLQFACLAASLGASIYLTQRNPFDVWMKARADAELARIALFDQVMAADESSRPGELPLLPLQVEYFRRYQLDTQQRYYAGRGAEHSNAAGHSRGWVATTYLLAGLAGAVAIIAFMTAFPVLKSVLPQAVVEILDGWLLPRADWANRLSLAGGVIASTIFSAAVSRSLMDLDERNASRYLTNADNLGFIRERDLENARQAAADGDREAVAGFVSRVHQLISSEHKEWVVLREAMPIRNPKHYIR